MSIVRVTKTGVKLRIPDGVNVDEAVNKYLSDRQSRIDEKTKQYASEVESPLEGMSGGQQFLAGVGAGMTRPVRGAANMLGLKSDEDTAAANALDKPIRDASILSPAGAGDFIGNTAALTAAALPVAPALGAAGGAVRAGSALSRTLAAGGTGAVAGGALQGALNADPGERGTGAVIGGALGGGIYGVLKGAGRVLSKGVGGFSDDFNTLRSHMGSDYFVPLNESGKEGWLRNFYRLISGLPGAAPKIRGQSNDALQQYVGEYARRVTPPSNIIGQITESPVTNPWGYAQQVRKGINDAFAVVAPQRFAINGQMWQQNIARGLRQIAARDPETYTQVMKIVNTTFKRGNGSTELTGDGLVNLYTTLKTLQGKLGGSQGTAGQTVQKLLDGIKNFALQRGAIKSPLTPNVTADSWKNVFSLLDDHYAGWSNFERAIAGANLGRVTAEDIAGGLRGATSQVAQGKVPQQQLAQAAENVFHDQPGKVAGAFQTGISLGVPVGTILTGTSPATIVPAYLASRALGSKTLQRGLVGDLAKQKALAAFLARNPQFEQNVSSALTPMLMPEGQQ